MAIVRIPRIFRQAYPGLTWKMPGDRKVLYITFDDGPTPGITSAALTILGKFNARATFFCIGRNAERHPEILQEIISKGHAPGNHTYSHLKGWFTPNREYFEDILLAARIVPSGLYRPAYGMITPRQVKHLKDQYRIVLWDVMSYDFHPRTSGEKCLDNVIRYARPGSVIVFHDSVKASEKVLFALPGVLEYFGKQGYAFESIPV
ncbi:MAG TPA: polysaccharide deacetylase family protein [Bacteroidales bacterium]|nr:polysaccharide deacetylase family protein [Bacteroidales bacterium]